MESGFVIIDTNSLDERVSIADILEIFVTGCRKVYICNTAKEALKMTSKEDVEGVYAFPVEFVYKQQVLENNTPKFIH